jgi:hypothetical protein
MNYELLQLTDTETLIDHIYDKLTKVDIVDLKLKPDFIRYIAEKIENEVRNHKGIEKVDKKEIFISILKRLFSGKITDYELSIACDILEYLLKHNLVKKTPLLKVFTFYLKKKFAL